MLAGVTDYLDFEGRPDCWIRPLHIQRQLFADEGRELTKAEYKRLVRAIQGTQSCYIMQVGLQAIFTEAPKQKSVKNKCCFPEVQFVNHGCNVGMGQ